MTKPTQTLLDAFAPQSAGIADLRWSRFVRFAIVSMCAGVSRRMSNPWWPRKNKNTRHPCQSRSYICLKSFWLPRWPRSLSLAHATSTSANSRWSRLPRPSMSSRWQPRNTADLRPGQGIGPAPRMPLGHMPGNHAAVMRAMRPVVWNLFSFPYSCDMVAIDRGSFVRVSWRPAPIRDSDNRSFECPKLPLSPLLLPRLSLVPAPSAHLHPSQCLPPSWPSRSRSRASKLPRGQAVGPARNLRPLSCKGAAC
jgi:hypothetical protein